MKLSPSVAMAAAFGFGMLSGVTVGITYTQEHRQVVPSDYIWPTPMRTYTIPPDAKVCMTRPDASGDVYTECVR